MNKHKRFIKEAYEGKYGNISQELKDTILKHYPEFKEVDNSGWFKSDCYGNEKWIAFYIDGIFQYGINATGKWFDKEASPHSLYYSNSIKAIPKEIESHLIEEAKKRGYGIKEFKSLDPSSDTSVSCIDKWFYKEQEDTLYSAPHLMGGKVVYRKGKWAEIVETITKEEAEKKLGMKII